MTYICDVCNTSFSRMSSLNQHKKKAKYCLELQQSKPILPVDVVSRQTNHKVDHILRKFGLHPYEVYLPSVEHVGIIYVDLNITTIIIKKILLV